MAPLRTRAIRAITMRLPPPALASLDTEGAIQPVDIDIACEEDAENEDDNQSLFGDRAPDWMEEDTEEEEPAEEEPAEEEEEEEEAAYVAETAEEAAEDDDADEEEDEREALAVSVVQPAKKRAKPAAAKHSSTPTSWKTSNKEVSSTGTLHAALLSQTQQC